MAAVNSQELSALHAEFTAQVADRGAPASALATLLDDAEAGMRVALVRKLDRSTQRGLYRKVEGFEALSLVDLVPADRGDLEEVRHLGLNTLPAFRVFEKRFCRFPRLIRLGQRRSRGTTFR